MQEENDAGPRDERGAFDECVLDTPRGRVFLRTWADPTFLQGLRMAEGMGAFSGTGFPASREHKALIRLATETDSNVTVAYNEKGEIVGFVVIAPPTEAERWGRLRGIGLVEAMAIEVSEGWRGMGIAESMMELLLKDSYYDDKIVMCTGYSWHWDLERLGLSKEKYREMLLTYLQKAGFVYYDTDEPNILMDPANFLAARIGPKVSRELYADFDRLLFSGGTWGSLRGVPRMISEVLSGRGEEGKGEASGLKRGASGFFSVHGRRSDSGGGV